jgi:hypothetical protein
VAETDAGEGSSASKHITKIITLAEDAVGAKVIFAAQRPASSSIQVYYRFGTRDEDLINKSYTLATEETSNPSDNNGFTFRDYEYLIGGPGGSLDPFEQMQFKFVLKSSNQASVQIMKDLRIIALSV